MGRYVIAFARQAGVRSLNVVRRPEVAARLFELGAGAVVVSGPDLGEQLAKVLGDEQIPLLLDAVGGDLVTELASRVTFGGTAACYGAMSGAPTAVSPADLIFRDVSVRGFWVKHWLEATAPAEIAETYGRLAALVADGTLRAPVAATYPLEQYREALAHAARAGRDGKILFAWWARSARPRSTSGGPKSGPKFPVL